MAGADSFQCNSCVCLGDPPEAEAAPAAGVVVVNPLEMGLPQLSTTAALLLSESRLFFHGDELAEAETLRRWWGFFEATAAGEAMSCG